MRLSFLILNPNPKLEIVPSISIISFVDPRKARSVKPKNAKRKPKKLTGLNTTDSRLRINLCPPLSESFEKPLNPFFFGITRYSSVYRINFSNDSVSALIRGSLTAFRGDLAATGNSNYGWFGGGFGSIPGAAPFALMSVVDRIDFSNDSVKASIRGSLNAPAGRTQLAATSNTPVG